MELARRYAVAVLATLALACGGLANSGSGDGGGSGGGGTVGAGGGGAAGVGSGGTHGGAGAKGGGGGGTKGGGGGGSEGSGPEDASLDDGPTDPGSCTSVLSDSGAPESSAIASFDFIVGCVVQHPMSCPAEHWEYPGSGTAGAEVYLKNTGPVPLVYTVEQYWTTGAKYPPGVPTGGGGGIELVGVLVPGANVDITSAFHGYTVAVVGAALPFSVADGGFAVQDEGTIPWPAGVANSTGATTMHVAEIERLPACTAVVANW
jgi:hypothetical protein